MAPVKKKFPLGEMLELDQLLKKYQNVKSWKKCEDIVNNKIRNEEKQILIAG